MWRPGRALTVPAMVHRILLTLLAGGLALPAAAVASGPQLYVAPSGDDAGPGTLERPFATLHRAQRAARGRPGAVVNLRAGTYRLRAPLRLTAADAGVTYQAYGHERAIISGGRRIAGWRRAGRGLWRARVGDLETRQLFVDGRRVRRAVRDRGLPGNVRMTRWGYVTDSRAPRAWRRPNDIELVYTGAFGYSEARCGVKRIAGAGRSTRIVMDQPCFRRARRLYREPPEQKELPPPTAVENSPSFLKPGTWYLDRDTLHYRGGRPSSAEAPVLEKLIDATNAHDVTLRGLTFSHATWLRPNAPAGFPHIYGSEYYVGGPAGTGGEVGEAVLRSMPGAVRFAAASRIVVERNRFTQLGTQALEIADGADNLVRGNAFDDISGGGIQAGGRSRVENNRVRDVGVDYRGSIGIYLAGATDSTVAHNLVEDTPYSGIVYIGEGTRVLANRVRRTANVLYDGGGIYGNGAQGTSFETGALVRGNVVTDTVNRYNRDNGFVPIGFYTDDFSDWVTIEANVAYGNYRTFGGVEPRKVRFAGNFWDDVRPGWYPPRPAKEVTFAGNTRLPRANPRQACAAIPACAAILASAGLEPAYRDLLATVSRFSR